MGTTCYPDQMVSVMRALRDSLIELHLHIPFSHTPNELAECSSLCTNLRTVRIELEEHCAKEFVGLLLPCIGQTLRWLKLFLWSYIQYGGESVPINLPCIAVVARHVGILHYFEVDALPNRLCSRLLSKILHSVN